MKYEIVTLKEKNLVGVNGITGNNDPQCGEVIGGLWKKFIDGGVMAQIKNASNPYVYGVYSDYDFKKGTYQVTICKEVSANGNPELTFKKAPAGKYAKISIVGDMVKSVADAWNEIWTLPLERSYEADFEEYVDSNMDGNAHINIYISLK